MDPRCAEAHRVVVDAALLLPELARLVTMFLEGPLWRCAHQHTTETRCKYGRSLTCSADGRVYYVMENLVHLDILTLFVCRNGEKSLDQWFIPEIQVNFTNTNWKQSISTAISNATLFVCVPGSQGVHSLNLTTRAVHRWNFDQGPASKVMALAMSPRNGHVFVLSGDFRGASCVSVHDSNGRVLRRWSPPLRRQGHGSFNAIQVSALDEVIITCTNHKDPRVLVYDVQGHLVRQWERKTIDNRRKKRKIFRAGSMPLRGCDTLVFTDRDRPLCFVYTTCGELLSTFTCCDNLYAHRPRGVTFVNTPRGTDVFQSARAFSACSDGSIAVLDNRYNFQRIHCFS